MTEVESTTLISKLAASVPLNISADDTTNTDLDESQQVESRASDLTTNIITDESKTADDDHHHENIDNNGTNNTDELNSSVSPTSKQVQDPEHSINNGIQSESDFDNDDIQKKMSGVINELRVESDDANNTSRKSISSNHLTDEPVRPTSASSSTDHHVTNQQRLPSPVQHVEGSSDNDGHHGNTTKTSTPIDNSTADHQHASGEEHHINDLSDDDQRPSSAMKQNILDETTRFSETSPKSPSSRVQSATSKGSTHVTPEEPSASGDEKLNHTAPFKLLPDASNDTDIDNQEVAAVERRPSSSISPVNRPRSPTPNDSRKASINIESSSSTQVANVESPVDDHSSFDHHRTTSPTSNNTRSHSPIASDANHSDENHDTEAPKTIVSPASRRESTNNHNHQQTSRPTSAMKTKSDDNSLEPSISRPSTSGLHHLTANDEHLKLITAGEQFEIPTDDLSNERTHSPPPLPAGTETILTTDSLLDNNHTQQEKINSRQPSAVVHRRSPTQSTHSNDKGIEGEVHLSNGLTEHDIHQPTSRRESQVVEQPEHTSGTRRTSTAKQHNEFDSLEEGFRSGEQSISRRESTNLEQKVPSRKQSVTSTEQPSSKRGSVDHEKHVPSRRESTNDESKPASRKPSVASEQQASSKRPSVASEHKIDSRRESTINQPQLESKRGSTSDDQTILVQKASITSGEQPSSKRGSVDHEKHVPSRRESTNDEPKPASRKPSVISQQQTSSKRPSVASEHKIDNRRESTSDDVQVSSRRVSTALQQKPESRKPSIAAEHDIHVKGETNGLEQSAASRQGSALEKRNLSSKRGSHVSDHETFSKNEIIPSAQSSSSRRESNNDAPITLNRQISSAFQQQSSPRKRESFSAEHEAFSHRNSHDSEQHISDHQSNTSKHHEGKFSNISGHRKPSSTEREHSSQQTNEKEETTSSSRRTSTNRDKYIASPHHSDVDNVFSPRQSSHRNSFTKQNHQIISNPVSKGSRPTSTHNHEANHQETKHDSNALRKDISSSETDVQNRISAKHKQERIVLMDKRKKSSSSVDDSEQTRSSAHRRSGQKSKGNVNMATDETIVTPIIMDSSKVRQLSGNRTARTDSDSERSTQQKLPPVSTSFQYKTYHSEKASKQQLPLSNRSDVQHAPSSRTSTPSETGQQQHWTKTIPIPSVHMTDDEEIPSTIDQELRPQSPNVEQIAERNKLVTPPITATATATTKATTITTSTAKKRVVTDGHKRKQQGHLSRRSTSADSGNHIRMVDDNSIDSSSDNNSQYEQHRPRHQRTKKRNVQTNTDETFDIEQHKQQQRSFFDERELTPQKPLKATKPISDHFHTTRRHTSNKEQTLTTPDSLSNIETPTIRRTVKVSKDNNQDKEPVNVNVTVVVKRFAGANEDGTSRTVTDTYVEQKPQQYFEPVQHPPELVALPSTTEDKEKAEEIDDRPKSTEQPLLQSSEQFISSNDRQIQSDTEQIITEKQKKQRRPKRISRTCQTYECVFRRMEREQQHDLRATSDTEKNIQTIKSQLRPRKRSPKKNFPLYLSSDSFRVEELLPKSFHQSRKNLSKSSALARSLSPQGGKLLILRPTLPFHHSDAVNVQRVCLQYAIDLIPNDNASHGSISANRNKSNALKHSEQTSSLPMIGPSTSGIHMPSNKSAKSASNKSEEFSHHRKNGGGV